jgi:hypothetical protein
VLPQREIRYYFSILKLMLLLLASLAFVAIGWPMIHAGAHPIIAWLGVGFFGLGALVILGELILFVWVSATRRAQMLERIKTTFAPELIQHNIWIDQEERLL